MMLQRKPALNFAVHLLLIWVVVAGCPGPQDAPPTQGGAGPGLSTNDSTGTPCPSATDSFGKMTALTYAVVIQYRHGPDTEDVLNRFVGTAFAIEPRRLATNAHVAAALEIAQLRDMKVVAVQSGTGRVVNVSLAVKHPSYTGDPLASPDVAILFADDEMPATLDLATEEESIDVTLGAEFALAGFPGDVEKWFDIVPGITVPQATALTGTVTALRSFDPNTRVDPGLVDIVQHQAPTTPGTSGSALVVCGKVIAVHNAGTMRRVLTLDPVTGLPAFDRQAQAANNFGIHVQHLRFLVEYLRTGGAQAEILPPRFPVSGMYLGLVSLLDGTTAEIRFVVDNDDNVAGSVDLGSPPPVGLSGQIDQYGRITLTADGEDPGQSPSTFEGLMFMQGTSREVRGNYNIGTSRIGSWWAIPT